MIGQRILDEATRQPLDGSGYYAAPAAYPLDGSIAAVTTDDGKVNAMSPMLDALAEAFEQAASDGRSVLFVRPA